MKAGERELNCARESGDDLTLARTYMNFGTTLLTSGRAERQEEYQARDQGTPKT